MHQMYYKNTAKVYINMKRILVLTHGELSKGFKSAHEVISAAESGINTVSLEPSDSPESLNEKIKDPSYICVGKKIGR